MVQSRHPTGIHEIGPLVVTWNDDGSVWAYANPPLRHLIRVDPAALEWFAGDCDRIDACMTLNELRHVAALLEPKRAGDPLAPYVRQWIEHRVRMIASGILFQPRGWGQPPRAT